MGLGERKRFWRVLWTGGRAWPTHSRLSTVWVVSSRVPGPQVPELQVGGHPGPVHPSEWPWVEGEAVDTEAVPWEEAGGPWSAEQQEGPHRLPLGFV